jgi:hypothetical protein
MNTKDDLLFTSSIAIVNHDMKKGDELASTVQDLSFNRGKYKEQRWAALLFLGLRFPLARYHFFNVRLR